jgi:putative ABC transport system permease protein
VEGWANFGANLAGASEPVRATAGFVSGGMLEMLGVSPSRGRLLTLADDAPNAPQTTVLSYNLWQRAFGGDPGILGRDVRLNGNPCTVVGVMPKGFSFPPGEVDPAELWVPLQIDPAKPGGRGGHFVNVLARLKASTGVTQAQAEMMRYAQHSAATLGQTNHPFDPKIHPIVLAGFQDEIVKGVKRAMLVLLGAVGFVLLIACVNVANLLLARSESRRKEIAVRVAIGAGMARLLGQFIVEGILLSLGGAALGLLVAFGGLRVLVNTNAGSIPRVSEIGIDWQVLLFALGISVATGVVFGLAPLIHMRASKLHDTLKSAAGRTTGAITANHFRTALVTADLALALVLLIGSGLMVKAFWKLQEVNAGFQPEQLLTMRLSLPTVSYKDGVAIRAFYGSLATKLNSLPGMRSAAIASGLPPERPINANDTMIENFVPVPGGPLLDRGRWRGGSVGRGSQPDHGEDVLAEGKCDRASRADVVAELAVAHDCRGGGGCEERGARSSSGHGAVLPVRADAAVVELGGGEGAG